MHAFVPITSSIRYNSERFSNISDSVNLQNVNGAKRSRIEFSTLLGDRDPAASKNVMKNTGVDSHMRQNIGTQGAITPTGNSLDLSISGHGFFGVLANPNARNVNASDFEAENFTETALANNFHLTRNGEFSLQQSVTQNNDGTITNGPQYIVDKDGHHLLGWQVPIANEADSFAFERTPENLVPLQLNPDALILQPQSTSIVNTNINLPHDVSLPDDTDFPQLVTIYDDSGAPRAMNLNFRYSGTENQWELSPLFVDGNGTEIDSADPLTSTITFDAQGRLTSARQIGVSYEGGNFVLDMNNLTSYGKNYTLESITHDGYPEGNLRFFEIDNSGVITGSFDNGRSATIAQVPIFDVANRDLLSPYNSTGGPKFSLNEHTMNLQIYNLLETSHARINSSTLELSTIDLANVFSEMIETQHSYSIANNALQIINDMTQVAYRLKS